MLIAGVDIDDVALRCFSRVVIDECMKFYADPENMKRFEAWKAERDAKIALTEKEGETS